MRRILFLTMITLTLSCNESKPTKIDTAKKTDTLTKTNLNSNNPELKIDSVKKVDIGYYEKYEKLPKLTFETITEKEFLSLVPQNFIQRVKPEQKNNFFYVQTAFKKHQFKEYNDYGGKESWSGFKYLGYYPTTSLFAIQENWVSDYLGFGQLFL